MAAQAGLSLTWSQLPKTGFLVRKLRWACPEVAAGPSSSAVGSVTDVESVIQGSGV